MQPKANKDLLPTGLTQKLGYSGFQPGPVKLDSGKKEGFGAKAHAKRGRRGGPKKKRGWMNILVQPEG